MNFLDSLGIGKSNSIHYWKDRLSATHSLVWARDFSKANKNYQEILKDLRKQSQSHQKDEWIGNFIKEAKLGLWAIQYLNNSSSAKSCLELLCIGTLNLRMLDLAERALLSKKDQCDDALRVYHKYLVNRPDAKVAKATLSVLEGTRYSKIGFDLLLQVAPYFSESLTVDAWVCKWAIRSRNFNYIEAHAQSMLAIDPNNIEANRFLGIQSELEKKWELAAKYYEKSKDWLRVGLVNNHLGKSQKAISVLTNIPIEDRRSPTWLYHAGWSQYKLGNLLEAFATWKTIIIDFPDAFEILKPQFDALQCTFLYSLLIDPGQLIHTSLPLGPEPYYSEACFRKAILFLESRVHNQDVFHVLEQLQRSKSEDPKILSLILLSRTSNEPGLEETVKAQLRKYKGWTDVYLWLKGLLLSKDDPIKALGIIGQISSEEITNALPAQGEIPFSRWIISQFANQAQSAMEAIGVRNIVEKPDPFPFPEGHFAKYLMDLGLEKTLRLIFSKKDRNWFDAAISARDRREYSLETQIIEKGIRDCIQISDWESLVGLVSYVVENELIPFEKPGLKRKLIDQTIYYLRSKKDLPKLEDFLINLLKSNLKDTKIHHLLAILKTQKLIESDKSNKVLDVDHDNWKEAFGFWSTVLTANQYWQEWYSRRSWACEDLYDLGKSGELYNEKIPDLFKEYFADLEKNASEIEANQYSLCRAYVEESIVETKAMRSLISLCVKNNHPVPKNVLTWVSPILIRKYAPTSKKEILTLLKEIPLPANVTQVIRNAFSPFSEIRVLKSSGQYELALEKLDELTENDDSGVEESQEYLGLKIETYRDFTSKLVADQDWDQAILVSERAYCLFPENSYIQENYVQSVIGWARNTINNQDASVILNKLRTVKSKIKSLPIEFKMVHADVLIYSAQDYIRSDNLSMAEQQCEKALKIDPQSQAAQDCLGNILIKRIAKCLDNEDSETAYEYAQKLWAIKQDQIAVNFYTMASVQFAIHLSSSNRYFDAINLLNSIIHLPYDPNLFHGNLNQLLAQIYVSYGAELYNSGNRTKGKEMMRQALSLDPTNETARNNLRISGGYY